MVGSSSSRLGWNKVISSSMIEGKYSVFVRVRSSIFGDRERFYW